jgi:hypothetical protein
VQAKTRPVVISDVDEHAISPNCLEEFHETIQWFDLKRQIEVHLKPDFQGALAEIGLTSPKANVAMPILQCGVGALMRDIIDQAIKAYESIHQMDAVQLARSRAKISQYLDKLISAGQRDPDQLTEFACAYLKELHEGPDPRFSGC